MLLHVMRHGPAQDRSPSGQDADRALTTEGRELASRAGRELGRRSGAGIVRILASPISRARHTAELVRSFINPHGVIDLREELLPEDQPPLTLVREIVALGGDSLIVGHQPSLEQLVRLLVDDAGQAVLPPGLRTAMIVSLQSAPMGPGVCLALGRWRLRMVLDPRAPTFTSP